MSNKVEEFILVGESILWESCFKKKLCVKIPFDGRRCLKATGCVRVIKIGSGYFVELDINGQRIRHQLVEDFCFPVHSVGVAHLSVCANPKIENGNIKGVTISSNLCIKGEIGPFNVKKCWKVIRTTIEFFRVESLDSASNNFVSNAFTVDANNFGKEYVYIEHNELEDNLLVESPVVHNQDIE